MTKNKRVFLLPTLLAMLVLAASILTLNAAAAEKTNTVLDGQVSITDSVGTGSVSGGTVTITAKGSLFGKKTNTVTITNTSGDQANISFDYTTSAANSFTIDGEASTSGTYNKVLAAGGTATLVLTSNSGLSNTTATLKLSNFKCTIAQANSNVTIQYDSTLGSVTAGGAAVTSGTTQEVSLTDGVALVATANGSTFLGWIDTANNSVLSTAASYTLTPANDMTVKAAFAADGGTPWFGVGSATQKSVSSG